MEVMVQMVECDNPNSKGNTEMLRAGTLVIGRVFYFNSVKSSKIESIFFKEDEIIIQTKNTKYTFLELKRD